MNRFIIETSTNRIAKSLCDQHIVKMPIEEAQMLCTALWHISPNYAKAKNLYKPVHQKHPCTLWAMETKSNYAFAFSLYKEMLLEYESRYGRLHGAGKHFFSLRDGIAFLPDGNITKHPQCFGKYTHLKTNEDFPIFAYRNFYIADKLNFARWRYTQKPHWLIQK